MRKLTPKFLAWCRSDRFREIGRRQCARLKILNARAPRCTATAKHTGHQCGNRAMENGKCWVNGGKTPRGDQWHRVQWPDGKAPDAIGKLNRKVATLEKLARKRKRQLARRSPEALTAYEHWQVTHQPGSAAKRAAARERRKQDAEARAAFEMSTATTEPSPELRAIHDRIAELEATIAAIDEAEREAAEWETGVFG